MSWRRTDAASTVFEDKVVVSGGMIDVNEDTCMCTNTSEVCDHIAQTWSCMPHMVERRYGHS